MGDPHKSQSSNFHGILGISKSASLSDICKAYKSLVMKWHPDRNPSNKIEAEAKFSSINEAYRALSIKKKIEDKACSVNQEPKTPKKPIEPKTPKKKKSALDREKDSDNADGEKTKELQISHPTLLSRGKKSFLDRERDSDNDDGEKRKELHISHPTLLSRTTSRITPTFSTSSSRRIMTPPNVDFCTSFPITSPKGNTSTAPTTPRDTPLLSKLGSQRCSTPIFFSQSVVRRKPPPVEKKLECTLEELCHGCVKMIKITRDAISSSGLIVEEDEIVMINVKPGWKKGTKITFEGKGDERPGTLPADIIFCIDEKRHSLFKREDDDLELGVEVPLVHALTGCTVPVPLLGGGQINLSIDDIIYPGYEKIIPGQGMPISEEGKRGDLKLKFLVEFPAELTDAQRSEVVSILEGCPS